MTPESAIQRAVFQHLCTRGAPNMFAFHPANGGYRKPIEAAIMKGMGVVAGVPDVIAIHNGKVFAIELKREGRRATDRQLATIAALREAGAFTAIAEGLDRAIACLEGEFDDPVADIREHGRPIHRRVRGQDSGWPGGGIGTNSFVVRLPGARQPSFVASSRQGRGDRQSSPQYGELNQ